MTVVHNFFRKPPQDEILVLLKCAHKIWEQASDKTREQQQGAMWAIYIINEEIAYRGGKQFDVTPWTGQLYG